MTKKILVSIIITTKNEEQVLARLLDSIKKQTFPNTEVIVVDNYSTDSTATIAEKYHVRWYTFGPERSAQRNFGAKVAKGNFLLFLDADMELSPNVIKECIEVFRIRKNIGGIVIPERSIARNFWERVKAFERSFYNLEGDAVTDAARFLEKDIFFKVGGYDETITGPEDWDLPENIQKKGYEIVRIKSIIKHYERINSLFSLMRKKYYYGLKTNYYLKKQRVSIFSPKTIYFLRPIFYKNWRKLISHPLMTSAMFCMLFLELLSGGTGFLIGNLINERKL